MNKAIFRDSVKLRMMGRQHEIHSKFKYEILSTMDIWQY